MLQKQAYSEVYYIIGIMPENMKNKIPDNLINAIENNMDKDYKVNPEEKELKNIELLEETKKILSVLYSDYIATDEEKEIIKAKERSIKNKKNGVTTNVKINELFVNKNNTIDQTPKSLIVVENDKWYAKVYKFFKKIFKYKK